jgi:ABC-2 type transport system permease protein
MLYMRVSIQNLAAYRFDMLVGIVMSFLRLGVELVAVWTIFHNTTTLGQGWELPHMLALVGVYRLVAGGIRMSIVPNMRKVLEDIREGTLDFVLMRPVNAQFLVSIREFVVWRVADVLLGLGVIGFACFRLMDHLPLGPVVEFVVVLAAGFAIVYSVWLMLATLCFWFIRIQNIEMVFWNVFEAGRFPIVIYRPWVQWVLTFVLPLAFITTIPAAAVFDDPTLVPSALSLPIPLSLVAVLLAAVTLFASSWFWRFGLRHYSGASA